MIETEALGGHARIIALVVFSILLLPLVHPQANPERDRERITLLVLIGLAGGLMLLLSIFRSLTC